MPDAKSHSHDVESTSSRQRMPGGGRKRKVNTQEGLTERVIRLIPLGGNGVMQWTTKSLRELEGVLQAAGYDVGRNIVSRELRRLGFQLNRNRELPDARTGSDVDAQFGIIDQALSAQLESGGPVVFLTGEKVVRPQKSKRRKSGPQSQSGDTISHPVVVRPTMIGGNLFGSNLSGKPPFRYIPYEIAQIDANYEEKPISLPDGSIFYDIRERSKEERQEILQRKREAALRPLDKLITEWKCCPRIAQILDHWLMNVRRPLFPKANSLLVLTHGRSPDSISPLVWQRAMDMLSRRLGITITLGRLPPATWRFTIPRQPLFSFTWELPGKKPREKIEVSGSFLSKSPCESDEIKWIPSITGRHYRDNNGVVSKRTRKNLNIRHIPPYGDWNYSVIGSFGEPL